MDRPAHDPKLGDDCRCFACHVRGVQFSPAATPTRSIGRASKPHEVSNSWEKGVPRDARNMPYLDSAGNAIGQKKWVEGERRKFQDAGLA